MKSMEYRLNSCCGIFRCQSETLLGTSPHHTLLSMQHLLRSVGPIGITSTGVTATTKHTAVDPSQIPYGSQVVINGQVYVGRGLWRRH